MIRSKLQKFDTTKLKVNRGENFRDIENYDVPSMIEEIVQAGRILEPLHVEEDGTVLKGNRRTLAAQTLLADPKAPQDIVEAIRHLDVFVYSQMTEKERTELILDHGSQKGLTRVEVVKAAWRLQRMMYSEKDIIILMYQQLAKYTGNTRKAYEASTITNAAEREKFLAKWLHGTVGNYILYAGQMGEYVREQFLLTDLALDRNLTDAEKQKVKFATTRTRISELNSAKNEDREKNVGWNPDKKIGKKFFELIDKYEMEDRTGTAPRSEKFSPAKMIETADSMQSDLKLVFLKCAGKLPEGGESEIEQLDCEINRLTKINALNLQNVDRIASGPFTGLQVQALVQAFISGAPNVYEDRLATFLNAIPAPEEAANRAELTEAKQEIVAPEVDPESGKADHGPTKKNRR